MSNVDALKENFRNQFRTAIDSYAETDPKCAFAAGMLLILSALKVKDGPSMGFQVAVMHSALREVGQERGWGVESNG